MRTKTFKHKFNLIITYIELILGEINREKRSVSSDLFLSFLYGKLD